MAGPDPSDSQQNPPVPPDPTDPAAREATIAHLRELLSKHAAGEPGTRTLFDPEEASTPAAEPETAAAGPAAKRASKEPGSHEEWVERGREIALRQLNFSPRSSEQLREAMLARQVPAAAAQEVVERLTRVGLIDDAEYAAMLVRTRQAERGLARRALKVELERKGIDSDTAEVALEQVDADDEADAARALVRKRVTSMRSVEPKKRRNRLYGTLARKGYSASAARAAIDEVLTEEGLELY
ncbi:MAG TPA: regulatory protein RecX [Beutenbergiaceae bacterium]|nr:regulatory protein RecX [Beutenbergiaceae bacterium]